MIRFEALVVSYPRAKRHAVGGITLEAPRGRITAIVGPNGSGKSTLVRALLGRVPVESGRILLDGADVATIDRRALARRMATVPQREEPAFPLPVREYVALARYPHLGPWRRAGAADERAVADAAALAGIEPLMDRRSDELSGGEWQRVRLARALAQGGDALVLDEPTTFLDVGHEMAIFEILHRHARDGRAVLLVSHQLNLVARFADEMILLHAGLVAAAGAPDAVMRAPVLERVYDWPVVVARDPAVGSPSLVPLRKR